jgi:hypothetical protein
LQWLSKNTQPGAIELLEENPRKIYWHYLSENPAAIKLLQKYPDKINWKRATINPAAIDMLRENPDKIHWCHISQNPAIFVYDYERMRRERSELHQELIAVIFHPRRVEAFLAAGGDLDNL